MVTKSVRGLVDNVVCLGVVFHRPYLIRQGSKDKIESAADKRMLRLGKVLVDSNEYRKLESIAAGFRRWLSFRALDDRQSVLAKSVELIPIGLLETVLAKLDEVEQAYMEAAAAFIAAYPNHIEEAKKLLADQFDANNYPSVDRMKAGFWVTRRITDFGLPSKEKIGEAVFTKELKKAEQLWETAAVEIQTALRESFADLVKHLSEKLTAQLDGSKKVLKEAAISNLNEFLDMFQARNLTNDKALNSLVERARKVLAGKKIDDIRGSTQIRDQLSKVVLAVDKLLVDAPKRRITLDD